MFIWPLPCAYTSYYNMLWHSHLKSEMAFFTSIRPLSFPVHPSFLNLSQNDLLVTHSNLHIYRKHLHSKSLHWLIIFIFLAFFFFTPWFCNPMDLFLSLRLTLLIKRHPSSLSASSLPVFFSYHLLATPPLSDNFKTSGA